MTDEMLLAQAQWLPQYRDDIPRARTRLEEAERTGTRVRLRDWQGAARLPVRTVEELAADAAAARANAAAADKGQMTASDSLVAQTADS
jgi:alpha-galactosidase